ncbi:MAG: 1-acyl-sn-glycerol-3-phosphate acyltransferase [Terriglobales bacterium]
MPDQSSLQRPFLPAKPSPTLLWLVQNFLKLDLYLNNKVRIQPHDLRIMAGLPDNAGVILTPNHADEYDPRVCLDLSRRCGRRFIFMGNREAFDEMRGFAGWGLQRIGVFSVERGAHDHSAKEYAIEVVKKGSSVFVIFPEGEVFYLNEMVQPFHSGAVDIGMQAIIEKRKTHPEWTAYVLPMAIKYRYPMPMERILDERLQRMEQHLSQNMSSEELRQRATNILSELLSKEEMAHNLEGELEEDLGDRIKSVRHAILAEVERRNKAIKATQARTIDRAWQLGAMLRNKAAQATSQDERIEAREDIEKLTEVAHLASMQPQYWEDSTSTDRLAEVVLKLERELYRIKRPAQLARREVFVRIGTPIDLSVWLPEYSQNPHSVRHRLADQLRTTIQSHIDEIAVAQPDLTAPNI